MAVRLVCVEASQSGFGTRLGVPAIAMLRGLLVSDPDPIDRHFQFAELESGSTAVAKPLARH